MHLVCHSIKEKMVNRGYHERTFSGIETLPVLHIAPHHLIAFFNLFIGIMIFITNCAR